MQAGRVSVWPAFSYALHANMGGHTGVPSFEIDAGARFFARHLK